jgi:hypothetical protein
VLISGELVELKRGEFITSIEHFGIATGLTAQRTRHFWDLLEKDGMIVKNSNTRLTRLTICKYERYQDVQQTNNKRTTNRQQTDNKQTTTDKNKEELNNNVEEVFTQTKFAKPTCDEVIEYFLSKRYPQDEAILFFEYHENANWYLSKGRKMKNWRLAVGTWMRNANKIYNQRKPKFNIMDV